MSQVYVNSFTTIRIHSFWVKLMGFMWTLMVPIERFKPVIQRNEHLHLKHCKNEEICRRIWKGPKNGRKQNTLRKHRESELATVGKTGGVLPAAFQVVI